MRPRNRDTIGPRTKLHLRVRRCGRQTLRLITFRPGTDLVFATNRYHDTWHILSDSRGARALAHLLWSLSYQRQPGTVALVDAPFLRPNPFDAEASDPIVVVPTPLTTVDRRTLVALRRLRGRMGRSDTTVRMQSHGLLDEDRACPDWQPWTERMARVGGCLVLSGGPTDLQRLAQQCLRLGGGTAWGESTYLQFADRDGEIQLFSDFRALLGEAVRARAAAGVPARGSLVEAQKLAVYEEGYALRGRRRQEIRARTLRWRQRQP